MRAENRFVPFLIPRSSIYLLRSALETVMTLSRTLSLIVLCLALSSQAATAEPRLERVVILMRHGVRPPTKSAAALAPLADQAWPDDQAWGAAPGDLTPHGAAAIRLMGAQLRAYYAHQGLLAAQGDLSGQTVIWADGADQRTRETARALAEGLWPAAPPPFGSGPEGRPDPLFDAAILPQCALDPGQALAAVSARGPVDTPASIIGLKRHQALVAPKACGGPGVCLAGASSLSAAAHDVKIDGPMAAGATLAENLLLEYENDLPSAQVAWGRLQPSDLATIMTVHERAADLTRATPYIGAYRAGPMARLILAALNEDADAALAGRALTPDRTLIVLVGHDTNLSNLAGALGLSWTLPGQPDVTAPGTALAFERWRDPATGAVTLRVRVFYQDPDQVRTLAPTAAAPMVVKPGLCPVGAGACALSDWSAAALKRLPSACAAPALAATKP